MKNQRLLLINISLLLLLIDSNAFNPQNLNDRQSSNAANTAKNAQAGQYPSSSTFRTEKLLSSEPVEATPITRRRWTQDFLIGGGLAALLGGSTTIAEPASAACLPGDLSKECIGVYKVPIDDGILPFVGTPEKLKLYAPDLNYIPPIKAPINAKRALELLDTQQLAAEDIQQVVMSGKLEEAGIKVLGLLPVVQSSGKFLVDKIEYGLLTPNSTTIDDLKISKLKSDLDLALGMWGECDMVIGQGLRGQLGVTTVAQLQILSSIKDAIVAYDDFLVNARLLSKEAKIV
ncbi:unnamed protein product [Cylindrotheca closterium]|uniref:Uncharacterized protein n=1 Tax=Cylindrotheca closterium TaxID=2856 RepID=A0AAD2JJY6_9STRA|nr:unnamed protein product [Cylindrotheca closterium]